MAHFKTTQFQILATTINRYMNALHKLPVNHAITDATINGLVDELCREFANDNRLFNETLFRNHCGNYIDKQNVSVIKFYIIIIKEEIIKNVKTLQKYRDKRIHPKDQNKR